MNNGEDKHNIVKIRMGIKNSKGLQMTISNNNTMEITYREYDNVRISNTVKLSLDDFLDLALTEEPHIVYWANGVLFDIHNDGTEDSEKRENKNEVCIDTLFFVQYNKYEKYVKTESNLELRILNFEKSNFHQKLTTWLKNQSIWNE